MLPSTDGPSRMPAMISATTRGSDMYPSGHATHTHTHHARRTHQRRRQRVTHGAIHTAHTAPIRRDRIRIAVACSKKSVRGVVNTLPPSRKLNVVVDIAIVVDVTVDATVSFRFCAQTLVTRSVRAHRQACTDHLR